MERNRGRSLLTDIMGHPMNDHPCIRAVIKSTANTNMVYWAGHLLALQEAGPPYSMDPDTLETTGLEPFGNDVGSFTFTAHPKIDQEAGELVTWGFGAGGELISYSVDRKGSIKNEHHIPRQRMATIHDVAMTENWLVFCQWPNHFPGTPGVPANVWDKTVPATFIVTPRHPDKPLPGSGWQPYEHRIYTHPTNSEIVHTAGAWEEDGKIFFEGTWPHDDVFPFWSRNDGGKDSRRTVIDLVRMEIDPSLPSGTSLADPVTLIDVPNEFPRIDERFYNKAYDHVFLNIYHSESGDPLLDKHIFQGLNATAMLVKSTGELKVYYPGSNCRCQEPVFIPRSYLAPEGDGFVIFAVDRLSLNVTNVVILDTKDFESPVAVIELPMRMRVQVHGNWVDASELNNKNLVDPPALHHMTWRRPPLAMASRNTTVTNGPRPN